MSIRHMCSCGAQIKLPDSAAGRKAKCKACGEVFAVPHGAVSSSVDASPVTKNTTKPSATSDGWLTEFAAEEERAAGAPVRRLDLSLPLDEFEPGEPPTANASHLKREDRDWISEPKRSFWSELPGSFVFFLNPANLILFVSLLFFNAVVPFIPLFGWVLSLILMLYMFAFYMAIVREVASGEDELPMVWISNPWDDLIIPTAEYVGTRIWVMLPAVVLAIALATKEPTSVAELLRAWALQGRYPSPWVRLVSMIGLAFWPVVVLAVAIGGTFRGLWPHVIIRTVLSAPLPYAAICAAVLAARVIVSLPESAFFARMIMNLPVRGVFALHILSIAMSIYGMIVAMRVIGLFYRHYKHRFPWAAE